MAWEWFTQELSIGIPSRNTDYNLSGTDESGLSNLANVWGSGDIYTSEGNTVKNNTVTVGNATLTINVGSTSSGVDFQFDITEGGVTKYSHHLSGLNHSYFYDKPQGIGFIVDTTLQRALTAYVYQSNRSGDTRSYVGVNSSIIAENQEYLYQFLQGLLPQQ